MDRFVGVWLSHVHHDTLDRLVKVLRTCTVFIRFCYSCWTEEKGEGERTGTSRNMGPSKEGPSNLSMVDLAPNIAGASFLCSTAIIEFTIPQIVKLSQATKLPLPTTPLFPHRAKLMMRSIMPQTVMTAAQFALVRNLRDLIDDKIGPASINLSIAYGTASVPFIAAKYNLLIADVYKFHGRPAPDISDGESTIQRCLRLWRRNVAPGLTWSLLRDCGSVGGGIVLGPLICARVSMATDTETGPLHRFCGGLFAGAACGFGTQLFHNTALTAGRMAETGPPPGTVESLRRVFAEHGVRAFYLNFKHRMAIIALWTSILTVMRPFEKEGSTRLT